MLQFCIRFVLVISVWWCAWAPVSAQAATWEAITVAAPEGQQVQYVDRDSIEQVGAIVRLRSYWLEGSASTQTHVLTEYHCDRQQYRDVEHNHQTQSADWQTIQADLLNQAVMDYACGKLRPS